MIFCHISFKNPHSHFANIKIKFANLTKGPQEFTLPAWRPGRYELDPFTDHIFRFGVSDEAGRPLAWRKTTPNTWIVDNPSTQALTLRYDYYAFKMDAGNSLVDKQQVYLNFINCIFYQVGRMDLPYTVSLDLPKDYLIACALGTRPTLQASSYHQLVDSPVFASTKLRDLTYTIDGHEFHLTFQGEHPLDETKLLADFYQFTRVQMQAMGGFPCQVYRFLVQSLDYTHYHGVEHEDSTVLVLGPNTPDTHDNYREMLLGVASHELFHAWNVTRIRPAEMSPYDFSKEVLFDTGFVAEGFTTYYGDLFLRQSGVFSHQAYYKEINTLLLRHFQNYGRFESSLLESSQNLWVDGYQKSTPSKKVSIYVKGALVSMILDIQIRQSTTSQHSLIDVIQQMYALHRYEQGGYTLSDVYALIGKIGGEHVLTLARELVETTTPIESILQQTLALVGCSLVSEPHSNEFTAKTGILLDRNRIIDIAPKSIAYQVVSIGDTLTHINGTLLEEDWEISDTTVLTLADGSTLTLPSSTETYYSYYSIVDDPAADTLQNSLKKEWLGDE
ncbi:hypothetical protein BFP72_00835 [Reichenbachiella sp. 5M10]|uniref:M61 family metallopeptidase n=1 Tax=Reichenbachiella sp. 5M10 TaxID=1889772 RepID=UPI000C15236A|nr:M61 family metallopeptidase [Reichenbachiella sp. 5M10]PIB34073.1 hypothetical protein BFP72_00835 [Reichenbachiella sp. 5M10]